jgi:hypothetical protein
VGPETVGLTGNKLCGKREDKKEIVPSEYQKQLPEKRDGSGSGFI